MIELTGEQERHMVELLKKKSVLIKNFSHKLEKYVSQVIEKCMIRCLMNY